MPILPPVSILNQVLPNPGLPYVQSQNFGQMVGRVSSENPDWDLEGIKAAINDIVRKIYDRRTWYGLMVRGQIATRPQIVGGTVAVQQDSNIVYGTGTSWLPNVIGRQFRIGYNTPRYTITAMDAAAQVLTLDLPWAGVNYTGVGYLIQQAYFNLGVNIKYVHTAVNLMQAWRLNLGYNQQSLDAIDPWRMQIFQPTTLAQMPAGPRGEYLVELWPLPAIAQGMPFVACVQPPNLLDDFDSLPPYIRTDIVTKFGIAEAKVHRGPKFNKYYDLQESMRLRGEAEDELVMLQKTDEDLYRQDLRYKWEEMRMAPEPGSHGITINRGIGSDDNWDSGW